MQCSRFPAPCCSSCGTSSATCSRCWEVNVAKFLKIANKVVNLDAIAYADFLESGRAMLFMMGLTQEKQNIPLEQEDARKLKVLLEGECG